MYTEMDADLLPLHFLSIRLARLWNEARTTRWFSFRLCETIYFSFTWGVRIFYFLFFDNANLEHRCNAIYSKYLLHRTIVLSQRFVSITAPEETAQRSVVMCLVMILSALKIL